LRKFADEVTYIDQLKSKFIQLGEKVSKKISKYVFGSLGEQKKYLEPLTKFSFVDVWICFEK
jgi:hypothetical protein